MKPEVKMNGILWSVNVNLKIVPLWLLLVSSVWKLSAPHASKFGPKTVET
jgi:hypothetical protein